MMTSTSQASLFPEAEMLLFAELHPLLQQVIIQLQPDLSAGDEDTQKRLNIVIRYALRKSAYFPVGCSEDLRLTIRGLRYLLKGSTLNRLQSTLDLHCDILIQQ